MRIVFFCLLAYLGVAAAAPAEDFAALVAEFDAFELANDPIRAGREGDLAAMARWPDASMEAIKARQQVQAEFYRRLEAIDADALSDHDQVSHAVLDYVLRSRVELAPFEPQRVGFTNDSGFFSMPLTIAASTRPRSAEEAEAWIARLRALPAYLDDHIAWLRRGLETDFVQPGYIVPGVIDQIRTTAEAGVEDNDLLTPLRELPAVIPQDRRERLQAEARAAVAEQVLPAYGRLLEFFEREYMAQPRDSLGISEVPQGREYYQALVRFHTTLDTTPEQVHQRGLAEVARIRAEMEQVIEQTGFEGSFEEFLAYLRTDPKFYAKSAEELLMHAAWIAKRADDAMPRFFSALPRLPYGVRPVPDSMAPNYTTGRYWAGNLETGQAGGYMVNTYALDQRPLYELPALTVHEAVPGHHHQIALAQELEDVPAFRRNAYITAFGEGWALYTEHLAIEMDIYQTPYEHFGRLTYEMWRACRLVVDTGLHYFGWSREQAEACLLENSALAPHNVRTEVARYISWPGQALAYKTGELLIRELRAEAEEALGEAFDIRAFHDRILEDGAMPLNALEAKMRGWIDEQKQSTISG